MKPYQQEEETLYCLLQDTRITSTQMTLYLAIYFLYQREGNMNKVCISRRRVMKLAKINSYYTYHKGISVLQDLGYVRYVPSYHPKCKTEVQILFRV